MRIPVDTQKVQVLAIGQPTPVLDFTTKTPKVDQSGLPLFKVAVVLTGTGDRDDPTTTITIAAATAPAIKTGDRLVATELVASSWTFRDNSGRERSGVSFRAKRLEPAKSSQ
jgi:hypothetical protein